MKILNIIVLFIGLLVINNTNVYSELNNKCKNLVLDDIRQEYLERFEKSSEKVKEWKSGVEYIKHLIKESYYSLLEFQSYNRRMRNNSLEVFEKIKIAEHNCFVISTYHRMIYNPRYIIIKENQCYRMGGFYQNDWDSFIKSLKIKDFSKKDFRALSKIYLKYMDYDPTLMDSIFNTESKFKIYKEYPSLAKPKEVFERGFYETVLYRKKFNIGKLLKYHISIKANYFIARVDTLADIKPIIMY